MIENKRFMEARVGIEPTGKGFADLGTCGCKDMKMNGMCTCVKASGPVLGQLSNANQRDGLLAAMTREPALAERLIDEMDRAGRDYMRLREVEAELREARERIAKLERQLVEVTALYDEYGEHRQKCAVWAGDPYTCTCGFNAADAAREKGGCPTNLTWQEQYPTTYVYSSPPEIEHLKRVVREKGGK